MTDKVLQEFSTRIVRAKALLDATKSQCNLLKKEAIKLEKVRSLSFNFVFCEVHLAFCCIVEFLYLNLYECELRIEFHEEHI